MNLEDIREYCINKPGVTESFPFNSTALVFKVAGKMFALLDLSENDRGITLKCDPVLALELREHHSGISPAWHFNKKHWNSVSYKSFTGEELQEWIDHSYKLVFDSLPKNLRDSI